MFVSNFSFLRHFASRGCTVQSMTAKNNTLIETQSLSGGESVFSHDIFRAVSIDMFSFASDTILKLSSHAADFGASTTNVNWQRQDGLYPNASFSVGFFTPDDTAVIADLVDYFKFSLAFSLALADRSHWQGYLPSFNVHSFFYGDCGRINIDLVFPDAFHAGAHSSERSPISSPIPTFDSSEFVFDLHYCVDADDRYMAEELSEAWAVDICQFPTPPAISFAAPEFSHAVATESFDFRLPVFIAASSQREADRLLADLSTHWTPFTSSLPSHISDLRWL